MPGPWVPWRENSVTGDWEWYYASAWHTLPKGLVNPLVIKGTIALAADFPTVALVTEGDVYFVSTNVTDNDATKTNTGDVFRAGDEIVWNGTDWTNIGRVLTNPLQFVGGITLAADFPTTVAVEAGSTYVISATVTDNDATKTNTGQTFHEGTVISWNGMGGWTVIGSDLNEKIKRGSAVITGADTTNAVAFVEAFSDASYTIMLTLGPISGGAVDPEKVWFETKAAGGFTITIGAAPVGAETVGVDWVAIHD